MPDTNKDTIYIDVDDEITSIIEKVRAGKHKIVALVLPKRATVLQSIVNMKLLKRTAKEEHKRLVLITSEANLIPLAGAVGIHVAKTLQSKPAIPPPPEVNKQEETLDDDETGEEPDIDHSKSIGELAGMTAVAGAGKADGEETIDVNNTEDDSEKTPAKKNKKSKINVPNFEKFRTKLMLAGLALVILIVGWIFAFKVWPHATVTINTNAVSIKSEFSFTANTDAQTLDDKDNIVPATSMDSQQTDSQKVAATGHKNVGEKATGTVSLKNCSASASSVTVPAGTTVNTGGLSFVTQSNVNLPPTIKNGINQCITPTKDVGVTATDSGTGSNIGAGRHFAVSGYPSVSGSNADAFAGGTDKTVTVISQSDIDSAKKKITDNNDAAKKDLINKFQDDKLFPLTETLLPGKQTVSTSAKAGDEATEVNVTVETDYTMLGVNREDLKKLVEKDAKKNIDTSKQALSDDGLDQATFSVTSKKSPTNQTLSVQTTATAGAQIDTNALKKQIEGKKKGDVQQVIEALPSVDSANVDFSPFWVYKMPSNPAKINIIVNKAQASPSNDSSSK